MLAAAAKRSYSEGKPNRVAAWLEKQKTARQAHIAKEEAKEAAKGTITRVSIAKLKAKERDEWLQEHQEFKERPVTVGPHYIQGASVPFPLNPMFRPKAPIQNETKNEIYEMAKKEPILAVAQHFGISTTRVQAIVKLKTLENEYVQRGHPIQTDLAENMDFLLGATSLPLEKRETYEQVKTELVERLLPFFKMEDEEDGNHMTRHEATNLLQLNPAVPPKKQKQPAKVIQNDALNTSKFSICFHTKSGILTRDTSGKLIKSM